MFYIFVDLYYSIVWKWPTGHQLKFCHSDLFCWWPCREVLAELSPRPATSVCRLVLRVKSHKDHCISHHSWPLARHWWQGGDPATLDETRRRKKEIRSCHTLGGGPGAAFTWCHEVVFFFLRVSVLHLAPCGYRRRQTNLIQQRIVVANCWHASEGKELLLSSVHLLIHLPSHLKLLLAFHDYQLPGFIVVKFGHALAASVIVSPWILWQHKLFAGSACANMFGLSSLLNYWTNRFSATQKFRFIEGSLNRNFRQYGQLKSRVE